MMTRHVARPTQFGELPATFAGFVLWGVAAFHGLHDAVILSPLLLMAGSLGTWTVGMRLYFDEAQFGMSIGPWRRWVDLRELREITWKMTGGWRSQGTLFISDRHGRRVPVYVGRFGSEAEWSQTLLAAAGRCGARVDRHADAILRRQAGLAESESESHAGR